MQSILETEEESIFLKNFQMYLLSEHDDECIMDLDDVYEWMGLSTKGNAKRFLVKHFQEPEHYQIISRATRTKGGQNKETIMLSVDTFKMMCMLAKTDRGKQTRMYYLKLEKAMHKHMQQNNSALVEFLKTKHENNMEQALIKSFEDTSCVYIVRKEVMSSNADDLVVKFGRTTNIRQRVTEYRCRFPDYMLLHAFKCHSAENFERYILNKPDVAARRINGTECLRMDSSFTVEDLVIVIEKNITTYNDLSPTERLKMKHAEVLTTFGSLINDAKTDDERAAFVRMMEKFVSNESSSSLMEDHDMDEQKPIQHPQYRKVLKYNPDDLETPVDTFSNIRDAARSTNDPKLHDYHITQAHQQHTVCAGARWFIADDDAGVDEAPRLPPTKKKVEKPNRRFGVVAQLDRSQTRIINLFENQKSAAKAMDLTPASITIAMNSSSRNAGGYFWRMYADCDETLKATYKGCVPNAKKSVTSSKVVDRIDPHSMTVVETYGAIQDVVSAFRTSHKKLNEVSNSGDIYKGYVWKVRCHDEMS